MKHISGSCECCAVIFQETGLTPRQLADQRNELLVALRSHELSIAALKREIGELHNQAHAYAYVFRDMAPDPPDKIERIARFKYMKTCNRNRDGKPLKTFDELSEEIKEFLFQDARKLELERDAALFPSGKERARNAAIAKAAG